MSDPQLEALLSEARSLREQIAPSAYGNGGKAEIHFNANGIGLWVAVTVCFMMAALNASLLVFLGKLDREVSEQGHQLNAIYMMAPHLKPKEPEK